MKGQVTKNIMEYMNSRSLKTFTYIQVSAIAESIKKEYYNRKEKGVEINTKTKEGKTELNKRIAAIANNKLGTDNISAEDIKLYKKCFADEYTDRTGKCAWGFKDVRKRLGYDPKTGLEIAKEVIKLNSAIGKTLSYENVESLANGTKIWIESEIPARNVFVGIKENDDITNLAGERQYSVADVGTICIAKEWLL